MDPGGEYFCSKFWSKVVINTVYSNYSCTIPSDNIVNNYQSIQLECNTM